MRCSALLLAPLAGLVLHAAEPNGYDDPAPRQLGKAAFAKHATGERERETVLLLVELLKGEPGSATPATAVAPRLPEAALAGGPTAALIARFVESRAAYTGVYAPPELAVLTAIAAAWARQPVETRDQRIGAGLRGFYDGAWKADHLAALEQRRALCAQLHDALRPASESGDFARSPAAKRLERRANDLLAKGDARAPAAPPTVAPASPNF